VGAPFPPDPSGPEKAAAAYRCIKYELELACLRRRNLKVVLYKPAVTAIIRKDEKKLTDLPLFR